MKRFLPLIAIALIFSACNNDVMLESFTKDDCIRLIVNEVELKRYDPLDCQLSYDPDNHEFRVEDDELKDYFKLTLSDLPTEEGQLVRAGIEWTTTRSIESRNNVALEVVKIEGDKVWLWNGPAYIAAVVRILE